MAQFKDFLTLPALHDFAREAGFKGPTAVQRAAIPRLLDGRSVSVLAQTGSGKTLAYALPVVELLKKLESVDSELPARTPRAWIICPTRELGTQIEKVFKAIAHRARLRVRHLKGSVRNKQSRATVAGPIDVLISSPNRALTAVRRGEMMADATRVVIFDEADQLFDHSFQPDVKALFSRLRSGHPQVGLFSATMPPTFAELRKECFPGIKFDELMLQGGHTLRDNIATYNYTVPFKDKLEHAVHLLEATHGPCFVFVNLKRTAEALYRQLAQALPDKKIDLLHGGMEKRERHTVLARFASVGDLLICTDLAARGLDLPGANWLLNYDLPFEAVYYVHRCGRVGRTGEPASVHNLVTTKDRALIARINTAIANQASVKLSRVVEKRAAKDSKGKKSMRGKRAADKPARGGTRAVGKSTGLRARNAGSGKRAGGAPAAGQPAQAKWTRAKPADPRARHEPTGGHGKRAGGKPAGAKSKWARAKPAGVASGKRTGGKPAGGKPASGRPSGARSKWARATSVGGKPAGKRTSGKRTSGKRSGAKPPGRTSPRGKGR